MVLSQWLERGLGQILAPDENYNPHDPEGIATSSFWNLVAPDTNYTNTMAKLSLDDNAKAPLGTAAGGGKALEKEAVVLPCSSPCEACSAKLCASCRALSTPPAKTKPATATSRDSILSPRPKDAASAASDPLVQGRVLEACQRVARDLHDPTTTTKVSRKVFLWCASGTAPNKKVQNSLRKAITKDASLLQARSSNLGQTCPDGYTPFMAAAYTDNVICLQLLWELAAAAEQQQQLLLEATNLQGQTAYHIAAQKGHTQVLKIIQNLHANVFGKLASPPVDLVGNTPLASALLSPELKAKKHTGTLRTMLFTPDDASVRGTPLPAEQRLLVGIAGAAEMPGHRIRMEDYVAAAATVDGMHLLAVADGHGDHGVVAQFVAEGLVTKMRDRWSSSKQDDDWEAMAREVCLETDAEIKSAKHEGGSVAVVVAVTKTKVIVTNVGDCRCILVQKAGVKELSRDHKPNVSDEEVARIEGAGLKVVEETFEEKGETITIPKIELGSSYRLAVSRSFGDFEYKANETLDAAEQAVVAVPEVTFHDRDPTEDLFCVAACDGVWDVMTNDEVADFVRKQNVDDVSQLPSVADALLLECLKNRDSRDNMSVVVIGLSADLGAPSLEGRTLDFSA